jgi:TPR repeat protein
MKRLWMTVVLAASSLGLPAQDPDRTLRPQQAGGAAAVQEARVALVIGNGGYRTAPLKNPVNDARAVAEALQKSGFNVTRLEDATRAQMREAIRAFGARISEGGVGLFYFAGHGMQVKGRNYLVPVGADIAAEDEVAGEAVEVDAILAKMETARNRLNILILDACRNNPFGRSFRSSQQGLAQVDAPTGTFVAFATAPGRTAADGSGSNGLYTEALLRQFHTPGLKLEEVFKRTRADVLRASSQQQTPWENSSIVGDFYFVGGADSSGLVGIPAQAGPAPAQPLVPAKRAPAPSPAEVRLLEALREKGQPRALALAKPLAAKGSMYGKYALGRLSKDSVVSHRAILEGAKQGIPLAMADLAEILEDSPVAPSDLLEARAWLEQAVALGEPAAMFHLGAALLKGELGPRDLPRAERLFTQAAQESSGYYYGVGCVYWMLEEKERVLPKAETDAKGFAYMRRGADLGDIGAMSELASAYANGTNGRPLNLGQALEWHIEIAKRDSNPYWAASVGRFYRDAEDPKYRNGEEALRWLMKAAEKGYVEALADMAELYRDGQLVPQDLPRALALHRKAAEKGHSPSQKNLAEMYEQGLGGPRNLSMSYFWFLCASRGGDGEQEDLDRVAAQLASAERVKIKAQAAKWKPKKAN